MRKQKRLIKKVKHLLKCLNCPRWLHHFGPKTYEFAEHLVGLLVRAFCNLSYERTVELLNLLGVLCPSKSALQYTASKLDVAFWDKVLKATSGLAYLVAIDSTGFSRTNPSYHYLRRIDGKMPKVSVKLSTAFDTRKKKFCCARIRVLPAHDVKDAPKLLKKSKPKIAVADKAYDSEKLHELSNDQGTLLMAPARKRVKKGFFRKKAQRKFRIQTYHRREIVESGFSAIKRKYGSSVSSRSVRTIRTELYSRLACHNIFLWLQGLLGWSRKNGKLLKQDLTFGLSKPMSALRGYYSPQ